MGWNPYPLNCWGQWECKYTYFHTYMKIHSWHGICTLPTKFFFFFFFLAVLHALKDLHSLTRVWTQATAVKAPSPNHWTARGLPKASFPCFIFLGIKFICTLDFFEPFLLGGEGWARILEWVAIPFSRRSSRPRDPTQVYCTVGRRFTIWATREVMGGSVVEFSPATQEARVSFPAHAATASLFFCSFPGGSDAKVPTHNVGDPGSIPGLGRSSGEGNGNPLQYSWGAW